MLIIMCLNFFSAYRYEFQNKMIHLLYYTLLVRLTFALNRKL